MNDQEVFDRVAQHLLTQRCKSLDEYQECCYRNPEGLRCAVGCLIEDDEYTSEMEGEVPREREKAKYMDPVTKWALRHGLNTALLRALQTVHDRYSVSNWSQHLVSVAKRFGLNQTVVDSFSKKEDPT